MLDLREKENLSKGIHNISVFVPREGKEAREGFKFQGTEQYKRPKLL